jgi:molybdopterin-guanine dinucleotide biosynthesis protein A
MGRDKALIEVDGVALVQHMVQRVQSSGCSPVVVLGAQPALKTLDLELLDGESSLSHPLAGIVHGLEHFEDSPVLFCPVDIPALRTDDLREMLSRGRSCVARGPNGFQPLLCVLGPAQLSLARSLLERNGSAHELIAGIEVVDLPESSLINCNRPRDLAAFSSSLQVS